MFRPPLSPRFDQASVPSPWPSFVRSLRSSLRPLSLRPVSLTACVLAVASACTNNNASTGPVAVRAYDQVQRLGNPLVSEVFLAKRSHPTHGAIGPAADSIIEPEFKNFVATVAGRDTLVQNTLAAVLLPDMLIVQTDKNPKTAGWLTWALANGYGGRQLTDDVVAAGLDAIFGTLIESAGNSCPQLCNDNVPAHTDYQTTFPYLGSPN